MKHIYIYIDASCLLFKSKIYQKYVRWQSNYTFLCSRLQLPSFVTLTFLIYLDFKKIQKYK